MIMAWLEKLFVNRIRRKDYNHQAKYISNFVRRTAQGQSPENALRFLLTLDNRLYKLESEFSKHSENGDHPKHRLTKYHDFFISNIHPGERVADLGSGNGALAYDIVTRVHDAQVLGVELDPQRVIKAEMRYHHPKLRYVQGDIIRKMPGGKFDVVVLSNFLEHVENREELLVNILKVTSPRRILVRVPHYNRDWRVPLKDQMGIDSRLNKTHFIEYTMESFDKEIKAAGLKQVTTQLIWGEIWCVLEPQNSR